MYVSKIEMSLAVRAGEVVPKAGANVEVNVWSEYTAEAVV
jgi:hypothetical protein